MLKLYRAEWQAGMSDQNSLARALQTKPDTVIPGLVFLFGHYNRKFSLSYLTQGRGNYDTINDDQYDWNVQGKFDKAIDVVKLVTGGSTPGLAGAPFIIRFKEKWFALGDILHGDEKEGVRVQEHPRQATDGLGWDYTVKLINPDTEAFVPVADVAAGKKWSLQWSGFEEFSKGGNSNSVAPTKLKNQLSIIRMKKTITAHTRMQVAVFEFTNPHTKKSSKYWLDWEEFLFMIQWYEQVERNGWYSIYNRKPDGTIDLPGENGRPVLQGAGIFQQISNANSRSYTELSTNILDEVLGDASFNMKDADNRKFVGMPGEMGFVEFHKAILAKASQYTLVDSKFITGSGQEMGLGGQFVTYRGLNGVEITLTANPILDNPDKNTKEHPISRRPMESYRIPILDASSYNGKANVRAVCRKGNGVDRSIMRWHVSGSVTPTEGAPGDFSSNSRASDIDGYELNVLSQCGKFLQNATGCTDLFCDKQ